MASLNLLFLPLLLYIFGELWFIFCIFIGEILIGGVIFGIGYAVVYSLDTWF